MIRRYISISFPSTSTTAVVIPRLFATLGLSSSTGRRSRFPVFQEILIRNVLFPGALSSTVILRLYTCRRKVSFLCICKAGSGVPNSRISRSLIPSTTSASPTKAKRKPIATFRPGNTYGTHGSTPFATGRSNRRFQVSTSHRDSSVLMPCRYGANQTTLVPRPRERMTRGK